jgi:hypothetical protein
MKRSDPPVMQIIKLRSGEKIRGHIIGMLDNEFIVKEAGKPLGNDRRKLGIYEVESVNYERRN